MESKELHYVSKELHYVSKGLHYNCKGQLCNSKVDLYVFYYFATLSSHLTIESITIMEAPVAPTKTNQHAQIGTVV